jgi:hypothetical protein
MKVKRTLKIFGRISFGQYRSKVPILGYMKQLEFYKKNYVKIVWNMFCKTRYVDIS